MRLFGLIGYPLEHSFSPMYFQQKFENQLITDVDYQLFPLENIHELPRLIANERNLTGFNVTIPYKETIIPFLDYVDETAQAIGAVNTVKLERVGEKVRLLGYNTDYQGFLCGFQELRFSQPVTALILGTGGASKAVAYALRKEGADFKFVSRKPKTGCLCYGDLDKAVMCATNLIVNASPVGMSPREDMCPDIPYEWLNEQHSLYDLVYNPLETKFLQNGKKKGARVINGLPMLYGQAEASWRIWNQIIEG